jgi:hypothetical protein
MGTEVKGNVAVLGTRRRGPYIPADTKGRWRESPDFGYAGGPEISGRPRFLVKVCFYGRYRLPKPVDWSLIYLECNGTQFPGL